MTKLVESDIELLAIQCLESLGFQYLYAPEIAPDGESPERSSYEEPLLINRLFSAIQKINPAIPYEAQQEALKEIQRINSPDLIANNEAFHQMLTEGIKATIYWSVTFDDKHRDLPSYVKAVLLQRFFDFYARLPEWNKEF
jgi:type I restriction enzyme R subunit